MSHSIKKITTLRKYFTPSNSQNPIKFNIVKLRHGEKHRTQHFIRDYNLFIKKYSMNNNIDQMLFFVLQLGEASCMGNWNYRNVYSPFTRIYYVTKGHAQVELPNKVQDLRPGYMYIIPAFTPHNCICSEEFCHYYIHIYNESDYNLFDDWILPTEIKADTSALNYIQRLCNLCPDMELKQYEPCSYDNPQSLSQSTITNKQRNLADRIESRAIIYILLSKFVRYAKPRAHTQDERIVKVLNHINTNIGNKISMDELANIACISKDYLTRLFKKELQTTPLNYVNKKRIQKAQLRIATETATIKEIAYQLGFNELCYFCRVFKNITGLTPVAYRNKSRPSSKPFGENL